jgi:diketogulonate reductase-like aldo/keto reductase
METITLNNGVDMPALGLGVFQTPPNETRAPAIPLRRGQEASTASTRRAGGHRLTGAQPEPIDASS